MDAFNTRKTKLSGPEAIIEKAIMKRLKELDWLVIQTHGNAYQMGLPDLYAAHNKYGARWIEVKNPENYSFTAAQIQVFPALFAKNIGIWILFSDIDDEIGKLFGPPNWYQYFFPKMAVR